MNTSGAIIVVMAKDRTKDRHKNPKMTLRLDPQYADALRAIAAQEERDATKVIIRALRLYAEQNSYSWPVPSPPEKK